MSIPGFYLKKRHFHLPALGIMAALIGFANAESPKVYFKRQGNDWFRVEKDNDEKILSVVRSKKPVVEEPAVDDEVTATARKPRRPKPAKAVKFSPYVAYTVGSWPEAVTVGDLNNDGRTDVALVTSYYFDEENDNCLFVFLQDKRGNFILPAAKYSIGPAPSSVAVGDVNGDGRNDVVVGRDGEGIAILLQNSLGKLNAPVVTDTERSMLVRIGNFGPAQHRAVAAIAWGSQNPFVDIYSTTSTATLDLEQSLEGQHAGYDDLEVGDLNNDGLQDVLVMSGQSTAPNFGVYLQKPSGLLEEPEFYELGRYDLTNGIGIGDLNGDGRNDIVASYGGNSDAKIAIWHQKTDGTLGTPVSLDSYDIPEPVEVGDLNKDGRAEVVVAHGGWTAVGVYTQSATGTLGEEQLFPIPYASHYSPHGLALGDINGDGLTDILLADYNNGLVVLKGTKKKK